MSARTCPWTGRQFPASSRGGNERVFFDDKARAAAHQAARRYTEHLIESGFLTWAELKRWDAARNGAGASYTTPGAALAGSVMSGQRATSEAASE